LSFSSRFGQCNLLLSRNNFKVPFFKLSMTCDFLNFGFNFLLLNEICRKNKKSVEKDNFIIKNVYINNIACKLLREISHFRLNLSTFVLHFFFRRMQFRLNHKILKIQGFHFILSLLNKILSMQYIFVKKLRKVQFFKLSMTCDFLNLSHVFYFVPFLASTSHY